jgi:thiol-disulfide isomerase/thioredoxin
MCLAVVFTTAAMSVVGFADDPPKDKTRSEQFVDLQKAMAKEQQAAIAEYREAKGKDQQDALQKYSGIAAAYALKFFKLAEQNPTDDVALEASVVALLNSVGTVATKATELIATHHADNPKLAQVIAAICAKGDAGLAAVKTLSEKSKNRDVRGTATYWIGATKLEQADYPPTGKPMKDEDRAAAFKDAEAILTKAGKEFGDVKVRNGTVGKEVEAQLFFINNLTVGKTMPDADSEDLDGKKVKISDYRGRVVVLDIWATWCGPCKAMIPHEREMAGKLKDKPFTLISLSADDKKETLTQFLDTTAMPWTHWWNGGARGGAVEAYKVRFFPTVYVLDAKGVIRHKHLRGDDLGKAVEKLLEDKAVGAKGD